MMERIYKVPFQYNNLINSSIKTIPFYYPEQINFTPNYANTDFDAEAMIYYNGKIHIFTKEWVSKSTTHHIINPEISENQSAEKIETYQTDFVVTDASYFDKKLYLIGYTNETEAFLEVFEETQKGIFFKKTPKRYYLGTTLSIGQVEGIAVNEKGVYISGEEIISPLGTTKPSFYFIPKEKFTP